MCNQFLKDDDDYRTRIEGEISTSCCCLLLLSTDRKDGATFSSLTRWRIDAVYDMHCEMIKGATFAKFIYLKDEEKKNQLIWVSFSEKRCKWNLEERHKGNAFACVCVFVRQLEFHPGCKSFPSERTVVAHNSFTVVEQFKVFASFLRASASWRHGSFALWHLSSHDPGDT